MKTMTMPRRLPAHLSGAPASIPSHLLDDCPACGVILRVCTCTNHERAAFLLDAEIPEIRTL